MMMTAPKKKAEVEPNTLSYLGVSILLAAFLRVISPVFETAFLQCPISNIHW